MQSYKNMDKPQLINIKAQLQKQYQDYKSKNLKLNMARGKPSEDQLKLSLEILKGNCDTDSYITDSGVDCRNYGMLDGIDEAKELFSKMLNVPENNVIVGGNSSLNMMYDAIARAMTHGVYGSEKPWCKYDEIKFLCIVPGYDRHFAICEHFGIKMISVPMLDDGPDMDKIEELISTDETIKGIFCVPKYSNPDGITYSDNVVKRFAKLKPKANDFRIFWDEAYIVHDLDINDCDHLYGLYDECLKNGTEDMPLIFCSTSKISFAGSGVASLGCSCNNKDFITKQMSFQTIGPNKINQLRHVRYFKDYNGIIEHMKKHAAIISPKFKIVIDTLNQEIKPLDIASWHNPKGGYFISFNTMNGCAKRVISLCKECGVVLTGAGSTYPYHNDINDCNIRIAPTFPTEEDLSQAIKVFCVCVKIATIEKLIENK